MKSGIKEAKKLLFKLHFIFQRYSKRKLIKKYQKKKLFKTIRQEKQKNKLFMNYYICIQKKKKIKRRLDR